MNFKGTSARSVSIDALFTPAEAKQIVRLADAEDRSAGGVVHWIVRRFLRRELVARKQRGGVR